MADSTPPTTGRIPPHSQDAERAVLGCVLFEPERTIDLCNDNQLRPESFFFPLHRKLFEVLVTMHSELRGIDLVTVREFAKAREYPAEIYGGELLNELFDSTPTSAHALHYIETVRRNHLLRNIIEESRSAIDKCYDGSNEVETLLSEISENFFQISQGNVLSESKTWGDLMGGVVKEFNQLFDNPQTGLTGISTGFKQIDEKTLGLQKKDMFVLAARPSMGKTSLALNIAENISLGIGQENHTPLPVGVFSLEMGAEQLVKRMLCSQAQISFPKLVRGQVSSGRHTDFMDAAQRMQSMPIYVDDTAGLDVMDLRSRARKMKRKYDVQIIIIDYLQLLNFAAKSSQGRQLETSGISSQIKAMAKELDVPVMVLSQLSRNSENRDRTSGRPMMSDLRDSGAIEQDADVIALLRRPCKYPNDPEAADTNLAIFDIAKNRNGEVGEVRMNFIDQYTQFQTRDPLREEGNFQQEA